MCVRVAALSSQACLGAAAHLGETETIDASRRVASPGLTASVQRATQTTCVPVKRAATQTDIGSCKYMYRYIYGLYIYLVSALSQAPLAARGRRRRRQRESERVVKG